MNEYERRDDQEDTMNINQTTMGGRITARRRAKGLTQQELADCLDVTSKAISKWETNEGCPNIKTIPALCKALGMTADELLTGEAPAPAKPEGFWGWCCRNSTAVAWTLLGAGIGGIFGILAYNHGWL